MERWRKLASCIRMAREDNSLGGVVRRAFVEIVRKKAHLLRTTGLVPGDLKPMVRCIRLSGEAARSLTSLLGSSGERVVSMPLSRSSFAIDVLQETS